MSNKEYMKEYRKKNKEHIRKVSQKRYLRNRERIIKQVKKWHKNHPEKVKERNDKRYAENKQAMKVRALTRYYFKLEGHNCEFCLGKAEQHHHNTEPIEFDKFNYTCKDCHREIPGRLLVRSKTSEKIPNGK